MERTQAEFLSDVRAAVEHLFAHRKVLRRVAVRFQFGPDGLVISASLSQREGGGDIDAVLGAARQELVPWARLASIDPAEFIGIVDRVCQPAHDLLGKKAQ